MQRLAALTLLATSSLAHAQTAQPQPQAPLARSAQGDVSVTIYNGGTALVEDVRQLSLPTGVTRQEFPDVSAQIRPETVTLSGSGIGIVEQNFDYDLLSPQALMNKAVGQTVTLVRVNPGTGAETRETARVLANNGGTIVQIGDRIEVLGENERVIYPTLPPNLRARPTLSVTVNSNTAGARPLTLSYLSNGLDWKADYVALFDEKAGRIDVQGWVTLTNNSGTTFVNADTLLVAGQPNSQDPQQEYRRRYTPPRPQGPPGNRPGTESAGRPRLGDYYLYPIGHTTIATAQQKQVSFLDVSNTPAEKIYFFANPWLTTQDEALSADTVLRFSSSRQGGLGDALPAGIVRVYMRDAKGQAQFIGENSIGHTPMGSALAIKTGEAFDVKVKPVVEKRERLGSDRWRTTMRYTLSNARPEPVVVDLAQDGLDSWWDDTRIIQESMPSERVNSNRAQWRVTVPANGEATVTATFDTRF